MTNGSPPGDSEPQDDEGYHVYSVSADESHSQVVVRGVAIAIDRDPLGMKPLAHSVDPDAIDDAFGRRHEGTPDSLAFTFEGRDVVVTPNWVYVRHDE